MENDNETESGLNYDTGLIWFGFACASVAGLSSNPSYLGGNMVVGDAIAKDAGHVADKMMEQYWKRFPK